MPAVMELGNLPAEGSIGAFASSDGYVQVWLLDPRRSLPGFQTIVDYGGQRLAVCGPPETPIVVGGSWGLRSLAGYQASDGSILWQRRLGHVQWITPSSDGHSVAVCLDRGPMLVVEAATGVTTLEVRAVAQFWYGRHEGLGLASTPGGIALYATDPWRVLWRSRLPGALVHDAAIDSNGLIVSCSDEDAEGMVTSHLVSFDLTGNLQWHMENRTDTHWQRAARDAGTGTWLTIEVDHERVRPAALVRWNDDGEELGRTAVATGGDFRFASAGRLLISDLGDLFETQGGVRLGSLTHRST